MAPSAAARRISAQRAINPLHKFLPDIWASSCSSRLSAAAAGKFRIAIMLVESIEGQTFKHRAIVFPRNCFATIRSGSCLVMTGLVIENPLVELFLVAK